MMGAVLGLVVQVAGKWQQLPPDAVSAAENRRSGGCQQLPMQGTCADRSW